MNIKITAITCVFLFFAVGSMTAYSEELLLPLTEVEEKKARAKNQYFIRNYSYFATRYRLVKVNTDLLRQKGRLSIEYFDDDRVDVDGIEVDINTVTGAISWFGILGAPNRPSIEDLTRRVGSEAAAEARFRATYGVRIHANLFETDNQTGANREVGVDPTEFLSPPEQRANRYKSAKFDNNSFYGVEAQFKAISSPTGIVLAPLGMGGDYHILYEVDLTKIRDHRLANDHPENLRRTNEYDEFVESLGVDPRERGKSNEAASVEVVQ